MILRMSIEVVGGSDVKDALFRAWELAVHNNCEVILKFNNFIITVTPQYLAELK